MSPTEKRRRKSRYAPHPVVACRRRVSVMLLACIYATAMASEWQACRSAGLGMGWGLYGIGAPMVPLSTRMESRWNNIGRREPKDWATATVSTKNPAWSGLGSSPGLRRVRLAIIRVSYGMTVEFSLLFLRYRRLFS
jgi:hypothetical protein